MHASQRAFNRGTRRASVRKRVILHLAQGPLAGGPELGFHTWS